MLFECRYCGREFEKTHNRQMYCSKECSTNARKEQDRIHKRNWWAKNGYKQNHKRFKQKVLKLLDGDEKELEKCLTERNTHWLIREIECQQLGLGSYSEAMYKCFKRANGRCELTGKKTNNLNIHHLDGYNWHIQGRCDLNNLIALDKTVHQEFHNKYGRGNNNRLQFNEFKKEYLNRVTLDNWM